MKIFGIGTDIVNIRRIEKSLRQYGQKFKVHLPDEYAEISGEAVSAEVVAIPFTESYNPNTRDAI